MKKRTLSLICAIAMIAVVFSAIPVSAATYDTPEEPDLWIDPTFCDDVAYSFAFVGDTQYLTCGDYYLGTNNLQRLYKSIADTADERKLEHVFILGDVTDLGYRNDYNLGGAHNNPIITEEWELAQSAISQLNGIVPYNITRGNHDDYMMDDYFYQSFYTDQFANGGFFHDKDAKWTDIDGVTKSREPNNPDAYVYWSAKSGRRTTSIANSYKTMTIGETDYLFMTIDFNPTDNVLNWVDQTLAAYPNHKAIITTHSYLTGSGLRATTDDGCSMYLFGNPAEVLWDEVLSQHANVFMVVSGHTGGIAPTYSYERGVNGNKVLQVLVDPQAYDAKEIDTNGSIEHGTQDTGMVLYMNFSKDGKRINLDYYSTLFNKFYKGVDHNFYITDEGIIDTDRDVDLSSLEEFGQRNAYLYNNIATAPTLNGAIGANEYSTSKVTKANEASDAPFESDLTEYFAQDKDYIYYAFKVKQSNSNQLTQIQFKPDGDLFDYSQLPQHIYPRYVLKFSVDDANAVTKYANTAMITSNQISPNLSIAVWDRDVFVSATRDKTTQMNTYELKISKDYLKMNNPAWGDLHSFGYMLHLGTDANAENIWHRWFSEEAFAAMRADGYTGGSSWMYQYIVFDMGIETLPTGSVRIYDGANNGLRFKTKVDAGTLDGFIDTYGKDNVSVGTLIAPKDLLGGKLLQHSIGTAGVDYIDVVATVNAPFEKDGDFNIYAGSIANIETKNLDRDFSAVGYIKIVKDTGIEYIYSDTTATRSVNDVAFAAFGDVKDDYVVGYAYLINDETDTFVGKYSPYSPAQREILLALMVDREDNDPSAADPYQ